MESHPQILNSRIILKTFTVRFTQVFNGNLNVCDNSNILCAGFTIGLCIPSRALY